ncbi:heavy metal translocating P-type ATPase [Mongoliimonas terrestris]|uniref:heavy metal translocating P-type ATPase n=1 Tax=Mongoliimonas terrestris TaxID=1709001 RepID=UPI0009F85A7D|nr:heavy metal translocating P-type ATPase [Mongoliimonas terrestris]
MSQTENRTRFRVEGMDCASCAAKVETAALRVPGVEAVMVSVTAATMVVTHGDDADMRALARSIGRLGYPTSRLDDGGKAAGHDHAHAHAHAADIVDAPWWNAPKVRPAAASGVALAIATAFGVLAPSLATPAFLLALAIGLVPIARRAVMAALAGSPFSIETLMTVAAVGAVLIGAAEEAAVVVFLFLVGEVLEGIAAARARASISSLVGLVPKTARVERNGAVEDVPVEALAIGTVILVRPGDRLPADGTVEDGASHVDEAPVTGESMPRAKAKGDSVFAGTVNGAGVLRVRVTAAAEDNTIARIVRLVAEAQESRAPTERIIDRFARAYTPAIMALAALVAVAPPLLAGGDWSDWIYKGLALLLIGCPCALVISTPAAVAAGLSAGARRGLLMKGGAVLETVGRVTVMALDKTGTLTEGRPRVTDVLAFSAERTTVLSLAAALEAGSSHPFAVAILAAATEERVPLPPAGAARAVPGEGVEGKVGGVAFFLGSPEAAARRCALGETEAAAVASLQRTGKSLAVLVANGRIAGAIAVRDEPRVDARDGLDRLRAAGIRPLMLTGDTLASAEAVGSDLGIEVRAGLMPDDKRAIVMALRSEGAVVGKVGDGINDAPALAAAHVGIAMGGGTDVALETADAAILHGRVTDLADIVALSRAVMANIRQNIAVALGLKALFLVTTVLGVTGLWPAILADTGATVLVTANAMRLLGWRPSAAAASGKPAWAFREPTHSQGGAGVV